MGKSRLVRLSDLRQAYRLIHDCRDVGHDPETWPRVLSQKLPRIVNAQIGLPGEIALGLPGQHAPAVAFADHGWLMPAHRALWQHCVASRCRWAFSPTRFRPGPALRRGDL